MSFYLSYCKNISKRKIEHIFYFEGDALCILSNGSASKVIDLKECLAKPTLFIIEYIQKHDIREFELLLPSAEPELLAEFCEVFSKFLLENDSSIGLLTRNPNYCDDYASILDTYGITFSVPPQIEICDASKPTRERKPKESPYIKSVGLIDSGVIKKNSTKVSHREDELYSGLDIDEPFNTKFIRLLNESGRSNVEVYSAGGITRQVFSNILSKKDLIPTKNTVICLIFGMRLNYVDAISLLACAGYALSKSIPLDVVVNKYLKRGIYDLDIVNIELDERGCSQLGWKPREN